MTHILFAALAAAAAFAGTAAPARASRLPSLRGDADEGPSRQLLDFTCGGPGARCCPGDICGTPDLTCSVERCRPCGDLLEPACTAVGAFPCEEGLTPIEGACFTDSAGVGRGSINTRRTSVPVVAVADPEEPDEVAAVGPAPVAVEPAPIPDVGPTTDILQLIADADEDCGDIGEACCVLELDEETVGACLTGVCPSDGAAVCAEAICGMPDGAEVQGVCVTTLPEDVEVPVDAGVPLPAPAAVPVSAAMLV